MVSTDYGRMSTRTWKLYSCTLQSWTWQVRVRKYYDNILLLLKFLYHSDHNKFQAVYS
ncbi:unnamed protein product [Schistosoma curassoni]|uniref:Ovule protein n=1 Tax=Schistosoma curassoni TaxID=6186 RepID=A0A183KYX5_9TREM|nr:unnamed protein product [Schistosoma curassoni]